ncbi:hypothetical protein BC834DRAFT_831800 [Gloeopeniophorella convolvens]|nr:hypothetical protein BC834DRAFT_831800 [Gloeopeniophorella convolvens]
MDSCVIVSLPSHLSYLSSETTTKAATRRANAKTRSKDADGKAKRPPSAYNLFVKEHMKAFLTDNPGKTNKDAMKHIGALWKDAPENPRRGQETKGKASKAPKVPKRSKKTAATDDSEGPEGPEVEPGSDD